MSDPNWSDFRVVLALAKGGSVAGAARILGVDASTASRRLAAAELAFGAPLVVRGGAAFALTAEGRAIAAAAEKMEATVSATTRDVRAMRDEPKGVVRIACVPTALHFLETFGAEVAATHPGLQVELLSARDVVDLARGDADIAIRTAEPTGLDLVVGYRFAWGSCLYASKGYAAEHGLPATTEDLRRHQLVRYDTRVLHLNAFGWIEAYADPAFPAIRIENSDGARVMIERGIGIGPLFCAVGDSCETLVRVFPEPFDQIPSWIVYHESARGSARVRAVMDALVAFHKARQRLLTGLGPEPEPSGP